MKYFGSSRLACFDSISSVPSKLARRYSNQITQVIPSLDDTFFPVIVPNEHGVAVHNLNSGILIHRAILLPLSMYGI